MPIFGIILAELIVIRLLCTHNFVASLQPPSRPHHAYSRAQTFMFVCGGDECLGTRLHCDVGVGLSIGIL